MIVSKVEIARLIPRVIFETMRDDANLKRLEHFEKLIGMGKSYFTMAQRVAGKPDDDQKSTGDAVSEWLDQIRDACNAWGASLNAQQSPQVVMVDAIYLAAVRFLPFIFLASQRSRL